MPEDTLKSLPVVMHTAHPDLYGPRPARAVKLGCSLLVLFLVLGTATALLLWAAIVLALLIFTEPNQQYSAMAKALLNEHTITVFGIVVCVVIGGAVVLPVAAFSEAEDFLLWLKRR